ncbi:tyrosine-type recombinase/integrase [Vibrio scophthalmi]|uniref:tyrosine-type recombinase/integrase n=1 Tax=Vibrio scophthalmi TaxID=45658 RepID=UPI0038733E87
MQKTIPKITEPKKLKDFTAQFGQSVTYEQVNEITAGVYARSSLLAMTKDWNLFIEFCQLKLVTPLPASTTATRQYIEKVAKEKKYATVKRYVVTISLMHRLLSLPDPTQNQQVQQALASIRINKQGDHQQTHSFGAQQLAELTTQLSRSSSMRDWRNLAIYHVMYYSLMKRKDLRDLCFEQLDLSGEEIAIELDGSRYWLNPESTAIVRKWLSVRGQHGTFVFSSIDRHENIGIEPLNDSSIFRILRSASEMLNSDVQFSGQSLRVGAVEELAKQGMKPKDIQHAGRWLSPAMPYQYLGNKTQAELEKIQFLSIKPIE